MKRDELDNIAEKLREVAREAGELIIQIYEEGFDVEFKADESPITRADRASHNHVSKQLAELFPDIPLLSEEGQHLPYEERKKWTRFFLLDPLDGTKEFVKRNGDFCVNIALLEGETPVLGVIHIPTRKLDYWGGPNLGAYRSAANGKKEKITTHGPGAGGAIALASRSHPSPATEQYCKERGIARTLNVGSAIKFCMVAEGAAQYYPRFNITWEWDTAAGHALVQGAGGSFTDLKGAAFGYNKPKLDNGGFLCCWK